MPVNLFEATDIEYAGNKAFNLMRIARAGIPVPSGFVISGEESLSDKKLIAFYNNIYVMDVFLSDQVLFKRMGTNIPRQVFIKHYLMFLAMR